MESTRRPWSSAGASSGENEHNDVYDALAELFLGEPTGVDEASQQAQEEAETPAPRSASTESASETSPTPDAARAAYQPAHLGSPRARSAAAPIELVVLGHLPVFTGPWAAQHAAAEANRCGGAVGLVRLGSGQVSLERFAADHSPPTPARDHRPRAFAEAIEIAQPMLERWIVRAEAVDEPALAANSAVQTVTVLTGTDDAAVVAAYRTIKGLAEVLGERTGSGAVSLRAAVMGAPASRAADAQAKLRRAVETFLDAPLEIVPPVQRISPTVGSTIYTGAFTGSAYVALEMFARPQELAPHEPEAQTRAPQRLDTDAGAPDRLANLISGLTPLESRCPDAPEVELAVDETGRLHLLARDADRAMDSLLAVEAWARRHVALLQRAEPSLFQAEKEATLHLLTPTPAQTRRLLQTRVRVHAIAPAPGAATTVCIDLN